MEETVSRHLIVVDTESNGLNPDVHEAVEVAWWNLTTDERGHFIPNHDVGQVLGNAEVAALQVNRYIDRIAPRVGEQNAYASDALAGGLCKQLEGQTLAGSNPAFDAAMLRKLFIDLPYCRGYSPTPWHHRMFDLSAYAAGVLGLDELPGLAKVCELLGIEPGDHTAEADVTATGLCIKELQRRRAAMR